MSDDVALANLRKAVIDYLAEIDNPAPDYGYRNILRDRMRRLVGAPPAPKPRKSP